MGSPTSGRAIASPGQYNLTARGAGHPTAVGGLVWRDSMKSTQGSQIKHNAAWRAFWIKIRELNARETDCRREGMGIRTTMRRQSRLTGATASA